MFANVNKTNVPKDFVKRTEDVNNQDNCILICFCLTVFLLL